MFKQLFVQSNYFNQITWYVIGQKFLVWPYQMIVLYIVQIQHAYGEKLASKSKLGDKWSTWKKMSLLLASFTRHHLFLQVKISYQSWNKKKIWIPSLSHPCCYSATSTRTEGLATQNLGVRKFWRFYRFLRVF